MQAENPKLHSPEAHLLFTRCLEEQGKDGAALAEYRVLVHYYPGQEARCRYATLLERTGHGDDARHMFKEICQLVEYGPRHQRFMQREWYDVARRALGR